MMICDNHDTIQGHNNCTRTKVMHTIRALINLNFYNWVTCQFFITTLMIPRPHYKLRFGLFASIHFIDRSIIQLWNLQIEFSLYLKRIPTYFIWNVIVPSILMTLTSLLVFALPCEAGEKVMFIAILTVMIFSIFYNISAFHTQHF